MWIAFELGLGIEANIDDMSPELAAPLPAELLDAGARDAWLTAGVMKKGRPGWVVSALVDEGARAAVEERLFRVSSTIGARRHDVARTVLLRRVVEVDTPFGVVPVKLAGPEDAPTNVAPEWEACRALGVARNVPAKRVYAEALAAFYRR